MDGLSTALLGHRARARGVGVRALTYYPAGGPFKHTGLIGALAFFFSSYMYFQIPF